MKKTIVFALTALVACATASAQTYIGGAAGLSKLNVDCTGTTSCDSSDTAFKAFAGYKFTPMFAGELVYLNFGKATATFVSGGFSGKSELSNTGFGGGVAVHAPLAPNWALVGRLGVAQVKTKIAGSATGFVATNDSDSNVAVYGGIGASYKFTPTLSLDLAADFTKSQFKKNGIDESGNVNSFTVGLTLAF